ncbi:MAG: tRNA lysidine(34) synthetase TilS [Coriobacteriales bacterium]|jgi:tRNA(Ile)-lysidine synthase|nr:tRNA lysidine(34) synthetase TilS [Coriobacteriales bacterium]
MDTLENAIRSTVEAHGMLPGVGAGVAAGGAGARGGAGVGMGAGEAGAGAGIVGITATAGNAATATAGNAAIATAGNAAIEPTEVILMVSGGSDSVALAQLLPRLYPQHRYTVLHVNHQLRGACADEDERFVAALARRLGLSYELHSVDIAARAAAQTNGNLEDVGRKARYQAACELLDERCRAAGCDPARGRIATAHTRDDRVETLFMRLIVGAGAGGLSSIPFVNGRVIRPLLDCARAELREALLREALREDVPQGDQAPCEHELWREDASNRDTRRLRAFVRHEVIPLLETRNSQLRATLARSLDVLAEEDAFLSRQAQELAERYLVIDRILPEPLATIDAKLFECDPVLVRRVIHRACSAVMPEGARLTSEHLRRIAREGARVGFATDIPGDVTVRAVCGTLIIRRKTANEQPIHGIRAARFSPQQDCSEGGRQKSEGGRRAHDA